LLCGVVVEVLSDIRYALLEAGNSHSGRRIVRGDAGKT
jgi:hypothetical protein